MAPPYCYDYPRPAVTVDLAVFAFDGEALHVLLVRRKHDPFAGHWALPGGFLEIDEPIEDGARRELREETGLDVDGPVAAIGVFGAPGRDPRGRVISIGHAAAVRGPLPAVDGGDDAAEASWVDLRSASPLAFDHDAMLATAVAWLERGVDEGPTGLALLPRKFEDTDVKRLFTALRKPARGALAWRKRQQREGRIVAAPRTPDRFQSVAV